MKRDTVETEVFKNVFRSIAEEMEQRCGAQR
jgi:hypothetical protein